jgi:hypothetical protein
VTRVIFNNKSRESDMFYVFNKCKIVKNLLIFLRCMKCVVPRSQETSEESDVIKSQKLSNESKGQNSE